MSGIPQVGDGIDAPNEVDTFGRHRGLEQVSLQNLDVRGGVAARPLPRGRRQIETHDASRWLDLIEQPGKRVPRAASRIQNSHPGLQARTGDEPAKLALGNALN